MNQLKQFQQEEEKRLATIGRQWILHRTMNTCSVCDSPNGHTSYESFLKEHDQRLLEKIKEEVKELQYNPDSEMVNIYTVLTLLDNKET